MKVNVNADRGSLRLRWTYDGQRYSLALRLPDTPTNRRAARSRADAISLDMVSGNFDSTLKKYKPRRGRYGGQFTPPEMFTRFMKHRIEVEALQAGSICRYKGALSHLERVLGDIGVDSVGDVQVLNFRAALAERVSDRTCKEYLILARACWDWGQSVGEVEFEVNPWLEVLSSFKVAPKQKVKPFSTNEVRAIEQGFKIHQPHYAAYVTFLFGTACRLGEANGLLWGHIADDYLSVWIGESFSRGVRKPTKTGKARTVELSPKVARMLCSYRPQRAGADDLVFPAPCGGSINDNNFRNRIWKPLLKSLNVKYRKPYATRHTAISHALENGADPLSVAEQTGHDPKTLFKNYASVISRKSVMVEF